MNALRWIVALVLVAVVGVPVAPAGVRPTRLPPSGSVAEVTQTGPSHTGARLLVRTGQRAADGSTFTEFSDPTLNNHGDLVFGALTTSLTAHQTVYLQAGGRLSMVVASGQEAPTGGRFAAFSDLLFNDRGTIGFLAQTTSRAAPEGLYVLRAGRAVPVVSAGDRAPTGGTFTDFANPTINNHDVIAFVGRTGGRESILINVEGSTTPVVVSGQPAPNGGKFEFFLDGSPALSDQGQIAFVASTTPRHTQGVYALVGGRPVTVVTTDDAAPQGGHFTEFGSVVLSGTGTIGFIGRTDNRGIPEGLYVTGRANVLLLAASGQSVPGGTLALTKFASAAMNSSEEMVFELSVPIIPLGVFVTTRAGVRAVVQAGDPAPGGGRFAAFSTPSLNDLGQIAFVAETDDGRHGIYLVSTR